MTHYYRLSGGGNDFLALAEPDEEPPAAQIRHLCRRGLSVGADGLFALHRQAGAVTMAYFNADGQRAELCLNGTRCAVRLAAHLGWMDEEIDIETDAGSIRGRTLGGYAVALELARPTAPRPRRLEHGGQTFTGWYVEVGVPHFVLAWDRSLETAPVASLGPALRRHPAWGAAGANINFVRFLDRGRLEIRTYERGVEAETLACGSGVMAAVATGIANDQLHLPVRARTLGGFELGVGPPSRHDPEDAWSLTGDARLIADGTLHPGALEIPEPPTWTA